MQAAWCIVGVEIAEPLGGGERRARDETMLTQEANERLTQTGPGTPMGKLLRRYWHPVATVAELDTEPVLAVRLLGENLALYRNDDGQMGLVAERCPHRGASLS